MRKREKTHTHVREKASFIQVAIKHRSTLRNERPFDRCTAHTQTHNVKKTYIHTNTWPSNVQIVNSETVYTDRYTDVDKHT